ncbi:hypothetical protein Pmani_031654 [Petrolisthes manimaculis]|uniref:Uncharacterized protein n=1 Tax=Petrolisthes manimaculis TaxID=1843537 RepID=A0AAE1TRS4_9EUCA|nr:hypothetical protein Pmani_031654 [Petrolisthes manimaculis]
MWCGWRIRVTQLQMALEVTLMIGKKSTRQLTQQKERVQLMCGGGSGGLVRSLTKMDELRDQGVAKRRTPRGDFDRLQFSPSVSLILFTQTFLLISPLDFFVPLL